MPSQKVMDKLNPLIGLGAEAWASRGSNKQQPPPQPPRQQQQQQRARSNSPTAGSLGVNEKSGDYRPRSNSNRVHRPEDPNDTLPPRYSALSINDNDEKANRQIIDNAPHNDSRQYVDEKGVAEDDEELLDLDEVAEDVRVKREMPPRGNLAGPAFVKTLVTSYCDRYHPPVNRNGNRLTLPVILPQRRPHNKSRGFTHAYAPMLEDVGISQDMFLDWLDYFEESIKVTPVFEVINMAANIVGIVGQFAPSAIAQYVSTAVTIADLAAKEVYQRDRAGSFMFEMNERWWKPNGLYCMIMAYKPGDNNFSTTTDITSLVAKGTTPASNKWSAALARLKTSQGTTQGDLNMPQPAPLIFPALDDATDQQKQSFFKKSGNFITDYFDRRANANFAAENPNSILSAPASFKSALADPTSQVNQQALSGRQRGGRRNGGGGGGGLKGLVGTMVSGGQQQQQQQPNQQMMQNQGMMQNQPMGRREERHARRDDRRAARHGGGGGGGGLLGQVTGGGGGRQRGGVAGMLGGLVGGQQQQQQQQPMQQNQMMNQRGMGYNNNPGYNSNQGYNNNQGNMGYNNSGMQQGNMGYNNGMNQGYDQGYDDEYDDQMTQTATGHNAYLRPQFPGQQPNAQGLYDPAPPQYARGTPQQQQAKGKMAMLKKLLKAKALYLMVTNFPSEEERNEVITVLEAQM